jgi:hypothetical protein
MMIFKRLLCCLGIVASRFLLAAICFATMDTRWMGFESHFSADQANQIILGLLQIIFAYCFMDCILVGYPKIIDKIHYENIKLDLELKDRLAVAVVGDFTGEEIKLIQSWSGNASRPPSKKFVPVFICFSSFLILMDSLVVFDYANWTVYGFC